MGQGQGRARKCQWGKRGPVMLSTMKIKKEVIANNIICLAPKCPSPEVLISEPVLVVKLTIWVTLGKILNIFMIQHPCL